jgi:hypothetical protein
MYKSSLWFIIYYRWFPKLYTCPLLSRYVEWLLLLELRRDRRSLPTDDSSPGVYDSALTVSISHKINNVPIIDPMIMPAMEPPDIQLHPFELVDCRASSFAGCNRAVD